MTGDQQDPHAGPVLGPAWELDRQTRLDRGRVQIFNASRPGGLDGWTMDLDQYLAVHDLILDVIDDHSDDQGTVRLQTIVEIAQERFGNDPLFPKGRLTNYVRYIKTDMEARCEVERVAALPSRPATGAGDRSGRQATEGVSVGGWPRIGTSAGSVPSPQLAPPTLGPRRSLSSRRSVDGESSGH